MGVKAGDGTAEPKTARALPRTLGGFKGSCPVSIIYLSRSGIRGMARALTLPLGLDEDSCTG